MSDTDSLDQAEALFHRALEKPAAEREAFLASACAGDTGLLERVRRLLAADASPAALDSPAAGLLSDDPTRSRTAASPVGQTLGQYQVLDLLGAGGMGEVYRARDTRLGRLVALKMLPERLAHEPDRLARLEREARALAALNHPNIAVLYGIEEQDARRFLVMELVEGPTLAERLAGGGSAPIPAPEALPILIQIAEALEAAHARGLVHRDLKPANVKLTSEGRVKVLDFGLAKAVAEDARDEAAQTKSGVITGTPAYMSPEQARGEAVDPRSDIWSFGCVAFEMLSGIRPFGANSTAEILAAVLERQPDWKRLPNSVPSHLRRLVERCLRKDPGDRYASAADLRRDLSSGTGPPRHLLGTRRSRRRLWYVLACGAALLATWIGLSGIRGLRIRLPSSMQPAAIASIAVLPLTNVSGDAEQDYVADGVHSALVGELAQIRALRVISRTSMLRYRNHPKAVPEVARDLDVQGVLEGTVSRPGRRFRIQLQLMSAQAEERQLWAKGYDVDSRDLAAVPAEAVRSMTADLGLVLTTQETSRLAAERKIDTEAYEAYLKGIFYLDTQKPDLIQKGLTLLHEANERDPVNALPYAGLARAYGALGHLEDPEEFTRARAAAQRALELDDTLADAHETLAEISLYREWDFDRAAQGFRRVMDLAPSLPAAHAHYAWYLNLHGRDGEALAEMKRAASLDPLTPLYTFWAGWLEWVMGRPDAAIREMKRALELNPQFWRALRDLGRVYRQQGRLTEALAVHERLADMEPSRRGALVETYAAVGRSQESQMLLASMEQERRKNAWELAFVYATLGRSDDAVRSLELAYADHQSLMPWLWVYADKTGELASLRPHPGFQRLVQRVQVRESPSLADPVQ